MTLLTRTLLDWNAIPWTVQQHHGKGLLEYRERERKDDKDK